MTTQRTTTREMIVDAAIVFVARNGLSKLTYRALAAEAGVSHGSVQHYFRSLAEVLEAGLESAIDIAVEALDSAPQDMHYIDTLLRSVRIAPDVHAYQYELILESKRQADLSPHVARLYQRYWASTARALERMGLDSDPDTVHAVFAAGEGVVFQSVALGTGDASGIEAAIRGLRRLVDAASLGRESVTQPRGLRGTTREEEPWASRT